MGVGEVLREPSEDSPVAETPSTGLPSASTRRIRSDWPGSSWRSRETVSASGAELISCITEAPVRTEIDRVAIRIEVIGLFVLRRIDGSVPHTTVIISAKRFLRTDDGTPRQPDKSICTVGLRHVTHLIAIDVSIGIEFGSLLRILIRAKRKIMQSDAPASARAVALSVTATGRSGMPHWRSISIFAGPRPTGSGTSTSRMKYGCSSLGTSSSLFPEPLGMPVSRNRPSLSVLVFRTRLLEYG